MTNTARDVLQQALRLDAVERAELIEALFRSFDASQESRFDALWAQEAESRIDAFEAGRLTADTAEAVFRRIGQ